MQLTWSKKTLLSIVSRDCFFPFVSIGMNDYYTMCALAPPMCDIPSFQDQFESSLKLEDTVFQAIQRKESLPFITLHLRAAFDRCPSSFLLPHHAPDINSTRSGFTLLDLAILQGFFFDFQFVFLLFFTIFFSSFL